MNLIDQFVSYFAPSAGVARVKSRRLLARFEATQPGRQIKNPVEHRDANSVTQGQLKTLRGQARHLDENYDYVSGALDVLVRNTVGASGIGVIPLPRDTEGKLNKELAKELRRLWKDFCHNPEVSKEHNWATANQLVARSLFRDGEVFSKSIIGKIPGLDHRSIVPYSLELLEADYCPDDYDKPNVVQGIQFNQWRQPVAYWFTDHHPGGSVYVDHVRRINAARVDHLKMVKRLGESRDITPRATAINRINSLAEYEHNEQIAAAMASALTAFIKKGGPEEWGDPVDSQTGKLVELNRDLAMNAGTFLELEPGEDIGTVQSNRPSGLLTDYVKYMMKGISAAIGTSHSSTAKDYDGTYSAQRQELVEITENYKLLTNIIVSNWVRPVWQRFVDTALLVIDARYWVGIDAASLYDAAFMGPQMPWIDPAKEATAFEKLIALNVASPQEIIHKRGLNPQDVLDQIAEYRNECEARGIPLPASDADQNTEAQPAVDDDKNTQPKPNEDH